MGDTPNSDNFVTPPPFADSKLDVDAGNSPAVTSEDSADAAQDEGLDQSTLSTYEQLMAKLFSARQLTWGLTAKARMWGWLAPLIVAVLGGVARFVRLGYPPKLVFDETYYVKGAYTLLKNGYENDWPDKIDETWNAGNLDSYLDKADYVVHPPLGKWMISLGMWLGGPENAASWRISTAVVSVIAIFLIAVVVRMMTGSTLVGVVAGSLFAIDGTGIVHARTGLLDSFLMFWVLVAFVLLVKDRQWRRTRLARMAAARLDHGLSLGDWGPRLGFSWYRVAGAFALGLSCGIKWSGLYFVAAFCLLAVFWDWGARYAIGVKSWFWGGFWRDAVPAALVMLPTALMGYLLAWTTWFTNEKAYGRLWHVDNPGQFSSWVPDFLTGPLDVLRSFGHYHATMMKFHTGLTSDHSYDGPAIGWLIQYRPTSFFWEKYSRGENGCGSEHCAVAITSIGNPILWWLATAAFVYLIYRLVRCSDWIAGAIVTGIIAGWVPWLFFPERTIFTFYTIVFAPFICMALAYVAYLLWNYRAKDPAQVKNIRGVLLGLGLLVVLISVFFYPIWTGIQVPYWFWQSHMWLTSWR